jgi:hypothetical protein
MFELQRQLLLVSLMVSHHRTYPPHDRPLCITPRNILSLWSLYQFLLVLSRFSGLQEKMVGTRCYVVARRSLRREKAREMGEDATIRWSVRKEGMREEASSVGCFTWRPAMPSG